MYQSDYDDTDVTDDTDSTDTDQNENDDSEESSENDGEYNSADTVSNHKRADELWWFWLLIIAVLSLAMVIVFGIKKYICDKDKQLWITASPVDMEEGQFEVTDMSEIEGRADEDDAISNWVHHTNQTNTLHTSL